MKDLTPKTVFDGALLDGTPLTPEQFRLIMLNLIKEGHDRIVQEKMGALTRLKFALLPTDTYEPKNQEEIIQIRVRNAPNPQ